MLDGEHLCATQSRLAHACKLLVSVADLAEALEVNLEALARLASASEDEPRIVRTTRATIRAVRELAEQANVIVMQEMERQGVGYDV